MISAPNHYISVTITLLSGLSPCLTKTSASSGSLRIDYAISREMLNAQGGKLYVQDVIAGNADEIFHRLNAGANIYFCGLKGMMPPILETMERVAKERGVDWKEMLTRLKNNHQWHVEVCNPFDQTLFLLFQDRLVHLFVPTIMPLFLLHS